MKHDKHTLTEKKFYVARKQLDDLREEMRNLPYRKLDEPYQEGWKLIVTLRDDITRSPKGVAMQTIIDKYAKNSTSKNPKHITAIRKNPTLEAVQKFANRHVRNYEIGIKDITEEEYKKLPDTLKKYFSLVPNFTSKTVYHNQIMYECNAPTYYFVIKVHKRMITYVQDIDPVLKKKEAELKKILEPFWRTTGNGMGYYHYFDNRSERRQSKVDLSKFELE